MIGDQSGQEKFFFIKKNNVFYEKQIGEMVHDVKVNFDLFIVYGLFFLMSVLLFQELQFQYHSQFLKLEWQSTVTNVTKVSAYLCRSVFCQCFILNVLQK